MTDKKTIWDMASKAGLALGLISTAYFGIGILGSSLNPRPGVQSALFSLVTAALWAAKFVACIAVMKLFMQKLVSEESDADNSDTFRLGVASAFLSALIYAGAYLIYVRYINPEMLSESISTVMEQMGSLMDSNARQEIDDIIPRLPSLTFFANLAWCFLYGTVLSAILSRNIPDSNPFSD